MDRFLINVNHQKSFLIETINKHTAENVYNITQSRTAMKGMLDILLGTVLESTSPIAQSETVNEVSITTESLSKKKPSKKKKETTIVDDHAPLCGI